MTVPIHTSECERSMSLCGCKASKGTTLWGELACHCFQGDTAWWSFLSAFPEFPFGRMSSSRGELFSGQQPCRQEIFPQMWLGSHLVPLVRYLLRVSHTQKACILLVSGQLVALAGRRDSPHTGRGRRLPNSERCVEISLPTRSPSPTVVSRPPEHSRNLPLWVCDLFG